MLCSNPWAGPATEMTDAVPNWPSAAQGGQGAMGPSPPVRGCGLSSQRVTLTWCWRDEEEEVRRE